MEERRAGGGSERRARRVRITRFLLAASALMIWGTARPVSASPPRVYAIEGVRILVSPGSTVESGSVVIRNGLIEAAGAGVPTPADAVVVDGAGRTLHAGFIDACSSIALPAEPAASPRQAGPAVADPGAFHPIARVRPERRILDRLSPSGKQMEGHRRMGFTAALVVPADGIFRGTSALVATGDGPVDEIVIRPDVAQHIALERGGFRQPYPTSLMGAMAAIRQGFEDARRVEIWQARYQSDPGGMRRPVASSAWEPLRLAGSGGIPVVFDVDSPSNALRSLALSKEYGLRAILIGSGFDYEVAASIAAAGTPVIVPLAFADKPAVDDEGARLDIESLDLERWLGARANPGRLARAGITIALATCRMKKPEDFPGNLLIAVEEGLDPAAALAALTTAPAALFGVQRSMGSVMAGKAADLVLSSGDPFARGSAVERVWVDGVEYRMEKKQEGDGKEDGSADERKEADPSGAWEVTITFLGRSVTGTWTIGGGPGAWSGRVNGGQGEVLFEWLEMDGSRLSVAYPSPEGDRITVEVEVDGDTMEGRGRTPSGKSFDVTGERRKGTEAPDDDPGRAPGWSHMAEGGAR